MLLSAVYALNPSWLRVEEFLSIIRQTRRCSSERQYIHPAPKGSKWSERDFERSRNLGTRCVWVYWVDGWILIWKRYTRALSRIDTSFGSHTNVNVRFGALRAKNRIVRGQKIFRPRELLNDMFQIVTVALKLQVAILYDFYKLFILIAKRRN